MKPYNKENKRKITMKIKTTLTILITGLFLVNCGDTVEKCNDFSGSYSG